MLENLVSRSNVEQFALQEKLNFNDEERIAILTSMSSIDVQACPGSGKTTLIASKLVLLANNWPLREQGICVLSHTNVAKEEIIKRVAISQSPNAEKLLRYPHFIGTIQEFTNRYLAIPFLKSNGIQNIRIDNDEYVKNARALLGLAQFSWLNGTLNGLGGSEAIDHFLRSTYLTRINDEVVVNIIKRPRAWQNPQHFQRAQADLLRLKDYLKQRGCFLFRDMYFHANQALSSCESLSEIVSFRFPLVAIDEMQDTQLHQEQVLFEAFPLESSVCSIQRFGDPDQAIFNGQGEEKPNVTFNEKLATEMDFVINKSHRFDDNIAAKVGCFSFNRIGLQTELSQSQVEDRLVVCGEPGAFEHTVIIFRDATLDQVASTFSDIVSNQFSSEVKQSDDFTVKILGAVGKEIDPDAEQLRIGHYWEPYVKLRPEDLYKAKSLVQAARHCRKLSSREWSKGYKLISDCILEVLRMQGKLDEAGKYYSAKSMRVLLEAKGHWHYFRRLIYFMLYAHYKIEKPIWERMVSKMKMIFEMENLEKEVADYLAFSEEGGGSHPELFAEEPGSHVDLVTHARNSIIHEDGFIVDLSTIHGAKGETHDATLLVETRNHCYDLSSMVGFMTGDLPCAANPIEDLPLKPHAQRHFKPNQMFMRQLYVAMSRPRYLLCLALHNERITEAQKDSLRRLGWCIKTL